MNKPPIRLKRKDNAVYESDRILGIAKMTAEYVHEIILDMDQLQASIYIRELTRLINAPEFRVRSRRYCPR